MRAYKVAELKAKIGDTEFLASVIAANGPDYYYQENRAAPKYSLLHLAVLAGNCESTSWLLEQGASINLRAQDANGALLPQNAWTLAMNRLGAKPEAQQKIAALLVEYGAEPIIDVDAQAFEAFRASLDESISRSVANLAMAAGINPSEIEHRAGQFAASEELYNATIAGVPPKLQPVMSIFHHHLTRELHNLAAGIAAIGSGRVSMSASGSETLISTLLSHIPFCGEILASSYSYITSRIDHVHLTNAGQHFASSSQIERVISDYAARVFNYYGEEILNLPLTQSKLSLLAEKAHELELKYAPFWEYNNGGVEYAYQQHWQKLIGLAVAKFLDAAASTEVSPEEIAANNFGELAFEHFCPLRKGEKPQFNGSVVDAKDLVSVCSYAYLPELADDKVQAFASSWGMDFASLYRPSGSVSSGAYLLLSDDLVVVGFKEPKMTDALRLMGESRVIKLSKKELEVNGRLHELATSIRLEDMTGLSSRGDSRGDPDRTSLESTGLLRQPFGPSRNDGGGMSPGGVPNSSSRGDSRGDPDRTLLESAGLLRQPFGPSSNDGGEILSQGATHSSSRGDSRGNPADLNNFLANYLSAHPGAKLLFTGSKEGGALASIAAAHFAALHPECAPAAQAVVVSPASFTDEGTKLPFVHVIDQDYSIARLAGAALFEQLFGSHAPLLKMPIDYLLAAEELEKLDAARIENERANKGTDEVVAVAASAPVFHTEIEGYEEVMGGEIHIHVGEPKNIKSFDKSSHNDNRINLKEIYFTSGGGMTEQLCTAAENGNAIEFKRIFYKSCSQYAFHYCPRKISNAPSLAVRGGNLEILNFVYANALAFSSSGNGAVEDAVKYLLGRNDVEDSSLLESCPQYKKDIVYRLINIIELAEIGNISRDWYGIDWYSSKLLEKLRGDWQSPRYNSDWTLLHKVAFEGIAPLITIIKNKYPIDAQDSHGRTALHLAASKGYDFICGILYCAGADASIKDEDGKTAIDLAAEAGYLGNFPQKLLDALDTHGEHEHVSFVTFSGWFGGEEAKPKKAPELESNLQKILRGEEADSGINWQKVDSALLGEEAVKLMLEAGNWLLLGKLDQLGKINYSHLSPELLAQLGHNKGIYANIIKELDQGHQQSGLFVLSKLFAYLNREGVSEELSRARMLLDEYESEQLTRLSGPLKAAARKKMLEEVSLTRARMDNFANKLRAEIQQFGNDESQLATIAGKAYGTTVLGNFLVTAILLKFGKFAEFATSSKGSANRAELTSLQFYLTGDYEAALAESSGLLKVLCLLKLGNRAEAVSMLSTLKKQSGSVSELGSFDFEYVRAHLAFAVGDYKNALKYFAKMKFLAHGFMDLFAVAGEALVHLRLRDDEGKALYVKVSNTTMEWLLLDLANDLQREYVAYDTERGLASSTDRSNASMSELLDGLISPDTVTLSKEALTAALTSGPETNGSDALVTETNSWLESLQPPHMLVGSVTWPSSGGLAAKLKSKFGRGGGSGTASPMSSPAAGSSAAGSAEPSPSAGAGEMGGPLAVVKLASSFDKLVKAATKLKTKWQQAGREDIAAHIDGIIEGYREYMTDLSSELSAGYNARDSVEEQNAYKAEVNAAIKAHVPLMTLVQGDVVGYLKCDAANKLTFTPPVSSSEAYGTHAVVKHGGLHFKHKPHFIGMEMASNSLCSLLLGRKGLLAESKLLYLSRGDEVTYYSASRSINGCNLQTILDSPEYRDLSKVDFNYFASLVISGFLLAPGDAKPDNFMVQMIKDQEDRVVSLRIIGIDNDIVFARGSLLMHKADTRGQKIYSDILNVLWLFPQMDRPLPTVIREQLTRSHSSEELMAEWLAALYQQNKLYDRLLESGASEDQLGQMKLPLKLPHKSAAGMYSKLVKLVAAVSASEYVTLNSLFGLLYPGVRKFYQDKKLEAGGDNLAAIKLLYADASPDAGEAAALISGAKNASTNMALRTVSKLRTKEVTEGSNFSSSIAEEAAFFIDAIDFSRFAGEELEDLLGMLGKLNFITRLSLHKLPTDCAELLGGFLGRFTGLTELKLIGAIVTAELARKLASLQGTVEVTLIDCELLDGVHLSGRIHQQENVVSSVDFASGDDIRLGSVHDLLKNPSLINSLTAGKLFKLLVRNNLDINERDSKGDSLLHVLATAVVSNALSLDLATNFAKMLIEAGIDVHAMDASGNEVVDILGRSGPLAQVLLGDQKPVLLWRFITDNKIENRGEYAAKIARSIPISALIQVVESEELVIEPKKPLYLSFKDSGLKHLACEILRKAAKASISEQYELGLFDELPRGGLVASFLEHYLDADSDLLDLLLCVLGERVLGGMSMCASKLLVTCLQEGKYNSALVFVNHGVMLPCDEEELAGLFSGNSPHTGFNAENFALINLAASKGLKIEREDLESGYDLRKVDEHGNSLLHHLCLEGDFASYKKYATPELIRELCANNYDEFLLACAAKSHSLEIIRDLLHYLPLPGDAGYDMAGNNLLALWSGNEVSKTFSKALHLCGVDVPINQALHGVFGGWLFSNGNSIIYEVIAKLSHQTDETIIDLLEELVRNGADINISGRKDGFTPLHLAASSNRLTLVEWLVERGASMFAESKNHNTAFDVAVHNKLLGSNNKDLVSYLYNKMLKAAGMDVSILLCSAAVRDQVETVEYLMTERHVEQQSFCSLELGELGMFCKSERVVDFLRGCGKLSSKAVNPAILTEKAEKCLGEAEEIFKPGKACERGEEENLARSNLLMQLLLRSKTDIGMPEKSLLCRPYVELAIKSVASATPGSISAASESLELVKLLMSYAEENGIKEALWDADSRGNNILHLCAGFGRVDIIDWLYVWDKAGVIKAISEKNKAGELPLDIARAYAASAAYQFGLLAELEGVELAPSDLGERADLLWYLYEHRNDKGRSFGGYEYELALDGAELAAGGAGGGIGESYGEAMGTGYGGLESDYLPGATISPDEVTILGAE